MYFFCYYCFHFNQYWVPSFTHLHLNLLPVNHNMLFGRPIGHNLVMLIYICMYMYKHCDVILRVTQAAPTTARKSAVWAYFTIKNVSNEDQVSCNLCDTKIKTCYSSTSNLFSRLKVHHPIQYHTIATDNPKRRRKKDRSQP